jgi:uncharacterized protein
VTVVCNATPLINFAAINRLDILQAVFSQIVIPQAVCDETTVSGFPASEFVLQAIAAKWLQVQAVSSIAANIPPELDQGEREAITLALETGEPQILLGLQVIGTLGILLLAKKRGIITQVQPVLDGMINHGQYWVSRPLYEQVLRQAGELV